jgi:Glycosyl hydrolases family 16
VDRDRDYPPAELDRTGYEVEREDTFESSALDPSLWLPRYLSHWSSREASAARFSLDGDHLRLRIDADQPAWCPEFDGWLRVSSIQTGAFSGSVGSSIGQQHFAPGMIVREQQPNVALYTPQYGLFELRACGLDNPANMVALWMIGYEDQPERSAEILIFEIFGKDVERDVARIGMGVRPHGDPAVIDAFSQEPVSIDIREFHTYAAEWTPTWIAFYVDDRLVKVVRQAIAYPMQFMLGVYEFADGSEPASPSERYPKEFVVDWFRGWSRTI